MKSKLLFVCVALLLIGCSREALVDDDYSSMIEELQEMIAEEEALRSSLLTDMMTSSLFTIGHCSDVHVPLLHSTTNLNEFIDFFSHPLLKPQTDLLLCTGDLCQGSPTREKYLAVNEIKSVANAFMQQNIPSMMLVGNHDNNINQLSSVTEAIYSNSLTQKELYQLMIEQPNKKWNYQGETDKCYYYNDFPSHKIRVLCMDIMDQPIEKLPGEDKVAYLCRIIFSQGQLEWLYQTLLNTPKDYGVIIAIHANPDDAMNKSSWEQGTDMLLDVIHAFQTGTSYHHKWESKKQPHLSTEVLFDFSGNPPGEFICWVGGHTHRRAFVNKLHKGMSQLMITTVALFTQHYDLATLKPAAYPPTLRNSTGVTRNSFNIIQVDRAHRKVIVSIFGAYIDIEYTITERKNVLSY